MPLGTTVKPSNLVNQARKRSVIVEVAAGLEMPKMREAMDSVAKRLRPVHVICSKMNSIHILAVLRLITPTQPRDPDSTPFWNFWIIKFWMDQCPFWALCNLSPRPFWAMSMSPVLTHLDVSVAKVFFRIWARRIPYRIILFARMIKICGHGKYLSKLAKEQTALP
jgi:hypothetical protein